MAGESSGNEEQTDTEERIAELQKEIEVRELQEELWKTNGDFSSRTSGPAAEIEAYIGKLPERIRRIREEIREFRKEIRELEQKKQDIDPGVPEGDPGTGAEKTGHGAAAEAAGYRTGSYRRAGRSGPF